MQTRRESMGRPRSFGPMLLDLPHAIIIRIAEQLPLTDLPNFIASCKTLAAMAGDFYDERKCLDMSCFEPAKRSPRVCEQLIRRFSAARLRSCIFRFDVGRHHSYDQETLDAILSRFIDNINPSARQLHADLRSGSPRMIDILAHCFFLDRLLSSQPQLSELDVDLELSLFKIPNSRGQRLDWHMLNPFVTTDAVQRNCSQIESYSALTSSFQASHLNLLHTQVRFLERCPRLRFVGFVFVLGTEELATYERLSRPLALERAVFYIPDWQVSSNLNAARVRNLGARLANVKKAVVTFKRRGCLRDCGDLFASMPRIESLYLRCEFNPRHPVYDIDGGSGFFFGDVLRLLGDSVSRVMLWGVPEDEFERLFGTGTGSLLLPKGIRELRVQLHWCSPNLDERRERLLDGFLKNSPHLDTYCIAGVPPVPVTQEHQPSPVFFKAKNWKPVCPTLSCSFIFNGSKRKALL